MWDIGIEIRFYSNFYRDLDIYPCTVHTQMKGREIEGLVLRFGTAYNIQEFGHLAELGPREAPKWSYEVIRVRIRNIL